MTTVPHGSTPAVHRAVPTRRAVSAALAVAALAPSAIFVVSAIGRSLQPTAHEPSRTLEAIVQLVSSLPPVLTIVLFVVLPPVAILLAAWAALDALRRDAAAREDLAGLARATGHALHHPTLLVSAIVALVGLAVVAMFAVHAIAG